MRGDGRFMLLPEDIAAANNVSEAVLNGAINNAVIKTDFNIMKFMERYPEEYAQNGIYRYLRDGKGHGWLGFWGGIVWLTYLITGEKKTKFYGRRLTKHISALLKEELFHSDLGFLVMPSCVADYKVSGSESALSAVIMAARNLLEKYNAKSGIICSTRSDNLNDVPDCKISNLLNVQVLVQANKFMGNDEFGHVAERNIEFICSNNISEDGRCCFRVPAKQERSIQQLSYSETRAYAWALYGMAVCYATTKDERYVRIFDRVYSFLRKEKKDREYYREFLEDVPPSGRVDSTSAAIIAAALTERLKNEETCNRYYAEELAKLLRSMIFDHTCGARGYSEGLLEDSQVLGTTGCKSTSTLCGDYFYLETLLNNYTNVESFWYVT